MGRGRGQTPLTDEQRARIWARVEKRLRAPRSTPLSERLYVALELLGAPAPLLARVAVSLALVAGAAASATVASMDALPSEPLYGVKTTAEQLRVKLAVDPADRAAVEISLAEHRLDEVQRLLVQGDEPAAALAATRYAAHVAEAAAALAPIERSAEITPPSVERLVERVADQQRRSEAAASALASTATPAAAAANVPQEPAPATPLRVMASRAPAAPGGPVTTAIAEHAASVARQAAAVAERAAGEGPEGKDHATGPGGAGSSRGQKETGTAEKAKQAAERAGQAADRARQAAHAAPQAPPGPRGR